MADFSFLKKASIPHPKNGELVPKLVPPFKEIKHPTKGKGLILSITYRRTSPDICYVKFFDNTPGFFLEYEVKQWLV